LLLIDRKGGRALAFYFKQERADLLAQAGEFALVVFEEGVGPGGIGVAEAVFGEESANPLVGLAVECRL
jgi:hypothetical protein